MPWDRSWLAQAPYSRMNPTNKQIAIMVHCAIAIVMIVCVSVQLMQIQIKIDKRKDKVSTSLARRYK